MRIGQEADLVVVAPATADLLARAATGQADDLLTNVLLTARCPVVMAPAMHTEMWEHPATQANVATLSERGVHVVPPASGRLTGRDTGPGRLPEPEDLFAVCERELAAVRRPRPPARTSAAARRPGRAGGSSSAPGAPASRSTRCATSATAAPASRGTPWRGPRPSAGADVTLVSSSSLPAPAGRPRRARRDRRSSSQAAVTDAVARRRRRRHGRRRGRLPAGRVRRAQDQEDPRGRHRRVGRRVGADRHARAQPRRPRRARRGPGERDVAGPRRLRRRDRRRRRARCSTTPAPSWPARAATCSSSTRSGST